MRCGFKFGLAPREIKTWNKGAESSLHADFIGRIFAYWVIVNVLLAILLKIFGLI
jgi:hypothetical protein